MMMGFLMFGRGPLRLRSRYEVLAGGGGRSSVFRKSSRGGQPHEGAPCYLEGGQSEGHHRCPMSSRVPSGVI